MIFLWAFVVGGLICVVGQIMMDVFKLTPAHTTSTLVVIGAIMDGFGWYEPLIDFAAPVQRSLLPVLGMPWFTEQWLKQIDTDWWA